MESPTCSTFLPASERGALGAGEGEGATSADATAPERVVTEDASRGAGGVGSGGS